MYLIQVTSSPYSKVTNDKFELAWDIYEVTWESGYLHMLEALVKLLSEENNILLDWYTVIGEEVSVGNTPNMDELKSEHQKRQEQKNTAAMKNAKKNLTTDKISIGTINMKKIVKQKNEKTIEEESESDNLAFDSSSFSKITDIEEQIENEREKENFVIGMEHQKRQEQKNTAAMKNAKKNLTTDKISIGTINMKKIVKQKNEKTIEEESESDNLAFDSSSSSEITDIEEQIENEREEEILL
ncbi:hypothetical protein FQA39_LY08748 [Lamprigera yunnana]|nr:hypothetical protein FQA39_LY08748 [Lamprigera yunnana]